MRRVCLLYVLSLCLTANASVDLGRILDMGTWSRAQLEEFLNSENYETTIATLRGRLAASVENSANQWNLDRNDSKQLASAFIAYVLVYVYPISKTLPPEVAESFGNASDGSWDPVGAIIREEIGRPFKRAFKDSSAPALRAAMDTLGIDEDDPSAMKLYTSLWLAYSIQLMASDYFNQAYNRAMVEFSTVDLATTSHDIIERISLATWRDENVNHAPEIMLLRKLMIGEWVRNEAALPSKPLLLPILTNATTEVRLCPDRKNVVSRNIIGHWIKDIELSKKLNDKKEENADELIFQEDTSSEIRSGLSDLNAEVDCVFTTGTLVIKFLDTTIDAIFATSQKNGNPMVFFKILNLGGIGQGIVMLANGIGAQNDILFLTNQDREISMTAYRRHSLSP